MSMRAEFEELVDDIAEDMGAMGPDVEYCRRDLVDLLEESAAMNRTQSSTTHRNGIRVMG